jgi:RES domain-containing protein
VALSPVEVPVTEVTWRPSYRIIPSRHPPIQLFERVADASLLEDVFHIESLTNGRLREQFDLSRLDPEDRVAGPGTSFIMGALTHVSVDRGGRFNDTTFGAYYAARELATAIEETIHHGDRFRRESREPPGRFDMRVLRSTVRAPLHDLRGLRPRWREVYDPDDYSHSQSLARRLRGERSWGIVYDSVRREGGECVAVYRPRALSPCKIAEHLEYLWDGERTVEVFFKKRILRRQDG